MVIKWPRHSLGAYVASYTQNELQCVSCPSDYLFSQFFICEDGNQKEASQPDQGGILSMVKPSWNPLKEDWRERWKITSEILVLPRFPVPQLRWFQGDSYACIPRSESISMFLSQCMCSGHILTPNSTPKPDLYTSFLQPAPVYQWKWNPVGEGWLGMVACSWWQLSTPMEHRSAKSRCESFLLYLLIQWKSKEISLNNWLFRAVRLQNGTEK